MNVFYSDSKTDLKPQYDYCIKFQLIEGAQEISSRLMRLQITPALQDKRPQALL